MKVNLTENNTYEERVMSQIADEQHTGPRQLGTRKAINSNRYFQETCKQIMSTSSSRFANFKPAQKVPYLYMQFFNQNHSNGGSQQDCYPLSPTGAALYERNISEYQSI